MDDNAFGGLVLFASRILKLPASEACAERGFSRRKLLAINGKIEDDLLRARLILKYADIDKKKLEIEIARLFVQGLHY